MSVKVKLHLPVPEGKPGDVVELSEERAAALVDRRYASYQSSGSADSEPAEPQPVVDESASAPVTELPSVGDKKAVWADAAEALGIATTNADGDDLTKEELIEAVRAATA